jgi:hypothetical protein
MGRVVEGASNVGDSFNGIIQSHSLIKNSTQELTTDLQSMNVTSENLRSSSTDIIESLKTIEKLISSLDSAADNAKSGGAGPSLNLF